jgi:hypothetical protein
MNETDDRLLRELLQTDDLLALRQRSLGEMLGCARARRRRRLVSRACLMAALPALLLGAYLLHRTREAPSRLIAARPPLDGGQETAQRPLYKVSYLSTDELLALFPNRPLALIGPPGEQRLVFLDQPETSPE